MTQLARDWRALSGEQRLAAGSAIALFLTMLLPWYQQNAVVSTPRAAPLQSRNLNAFQVFTFVEAAVLLVALAVLYLLYARAEGRDFHLPGSDGSVVMAAGLWSALLLIFRLFDKPGISSHGIAANVGVQWGIFFALAASGLMVYAGSRMRATRPLEPPLARSAPPREPPPNDPPDQPFDEAPRSRYPPAPSRPASSDQSPTRSAPDAPRGSRSRRPIAAARRSEQLSFEDSPPAGD